MKNLINGILIALAFVLGSINGWFITNSRQDKNKVPDWMEVTPVRNGLSSYSFRVGGEQVVLMKWEGKGFENLRVYGTNAPHLIRVRTSPTAYAVNWQDESVILCDEQTRTNWFLLIDDR